MADRKAACDRLVAALQSLQMKQADLAREANCGKVAVSKVSRGEQWPTVEMLEALAKNHNVSSTWILLGLGPVQILKVSEEQQAIQELMVRVLSAGGESAARRVQGYLEALAQELPRREAKIA